MSELRGAAQVALAASASTVELERKLINKTARRSQSIESVSGSEDVQPTQKQPLRSPVQAIKRNHKPAAKDLIGIGAVLLFVLALLWIVMKSPLM